jgi:AcrR family transcriptional regulator
MLSPSQTRFCPKRVGRPLKGGSSGSRQAILEVAIKMFAEKGIAASTIKEISRRADVTPALVHYHFEDKQGLVTQTLDTFLPPLAQNVWAAVDIDCSPIEMLEEIHKRLREIHKLKPWFPALWSRELANQGGRLRGYMFSLIDMERLKKYREKIRLGQSQGLINPKLVPELIFISMVSGLFLPMLTSKAWEKAWADRKITTQMVLDHVWALAKDGLSAGKAD